MDNRDLRHITINATQDLKLGKFTHADAGQMHMYLNYAREHWTHPDENPPVGLILCDEKSEAVVHYKLENMPNKILAAEYLTALPDKALLEAEIERTRRILETRRSEQKLEQKLLQGMHSGPATPMTEQDWKSIKQRGIKRIKQRRSK